MSRITINLVKNPQRHAGGFLLDLSIFISNAS